MKKSINPISWPSGEAFAERAEIAFDEVMTAATIPGLKIDMSGR